MSSIRDKREYISERTGFDQGAEFQSEAEVYEYFSPKSQRAMFGAEACQNPDDLADWAKLVIENRWHCDWRNDE